MQKEKSCKKILRILHFLFWPVRIKNAEDSFIITRAGEAFNLKSFVLCKARKSVSDILTLTHYSVILEKIGIEARGR